MKQYIPEGFTKKECHVFMEDYDLTNLAKKYGTPLIIYSRKKIENNLRELESAFSKFFEKFSIKYAVKSNNNPYILQIINKLGHGTDTSSRNEIAMSLKAGIAGDKISFSGNNISKDELDIAIQTGARINFDSLGQLKVLNEKVPKIVGFRIKTGYGRGQFKGLTTSGTGAKFGELPDKALEGYKIAMKNGCRRFGIQIMAGSNVTDPDHFFKVGSDISELAVKFQRTLGIVFEYVDIGGGFGVPYRINEEKIDIKKVAENVYKAFKLNFNGAGYKIPELVIEPGRYIVANSGVLLGTVMDIKKQEMNYVGTDAGMNILLRPALYGAYHHLIIANKADQEANFMADVTGQICENTDRIASGIYIPEPEIGDTVVIFNAGAYVESMASHYNGREIPPEILIDSGRMEVIREREKPLEF